MDVSPGVVNVKESHDLGAAQREPKGVQARPGDGGLRRDAEGGEDVVGGVSEKKEYWESRTVSDGYRKFMKQFVQKISSERP